MFSIHGLLPVYNPKFDLFLSRAEATWLAMQSRGYWLTSADTFLVEIAATMMARYRIDELKSGDGSQLIGLLGRMGFSPGERGKLKCPGGTGTEGRLTSEFNF
jgi:hypothetical protein